MDYLSALNALAIPEYQQGLIDQRVMKSVLMQRLKPRIKAAKFDAGGNLIMGVETLVPIPGGARTEGQDVMLPGKHAYAQMSEDVKQLMNVAGISKEVMERLSKAGKQAFANEPDRVLKNCGMGMDVLLNIALHGDSTGRLGQVASATGDGTGCVVTLDNTREDFGWAGTAMIWPGMRVDIKTWADGTEKVLGMTIISMTSTTITLGSVATYGGTYSAAPADNDIVFISGSATWGGSSWTFNMPNGILNLIDDGATTAGPGSGRNGSWAGASLHGLDRTTANGAHLKAQIMKANDWGSGTAGTPASFDLDDIEAQIDNVEHYGSSGSTVTAMYCTAKTVRAIKRKSVLEMGAMYQVGDGEIVPGRHVNYYNYNGRKIPFIPIPTLPESTIIFADENQITWHEHVPLGFCDDYPTKPWFPAPGERNLTFEAWMRTVYNLTVKNASGMVRMEDLNTDE